MKFTYDDGGRSAAGFKGRASDCVVRAIAIATQSPYASIYNAINDAAETEHYDRWKHAGGRSSARTGVHKHTTRSFMASLGWQWTPTMGFGTGCRVHLRDGELPPGRLVVSVSRHLVAVIDGVIHDTHDPSRDGTRCVYGYWRKS